MTLLADRDVRVVIARLKSAIAESDYSLRGLADRAETLGLESPEALHHSVLSELLRSRPGRNLYFQTLLSICKIIDIHPAEVLFGRNIGLAVQAMEKLPEREQTEVLLDLEERLSHRRATGGLRKRIRETTG